MARRKNHVRNGPCAACQVERDYHPADTERFAVAVDEFTRELSRLPDPFSGAVSALTADDVQWGMNRITPDRRGDVLQELQLGRMRPSKCSKSMCESILSRLDSPKGRFAARTFSRPIASALANDDFPVRLGCLYLWSSLGGGDTPGAHAADARIIVAFAKLPWWLPPGVSAEQGQAVLDAALAVIEASPDFPDEHAEPRTSQDAHRRNPQPEAGRPSASDAGTATEEASDTPTRHSDDPALAAEALKEAWTQAKEVAAKLTKEIAAGIVPADPTFPAIATLIAQADRARRLAGADLAIPDLLTALHQTAEHRELAAELAGLGRLEGDKDRLKELAELVDVLTDTTPWDQEHRRLAEAVIALHSLADLYAAAGGVPSDTTAFNALAGKAGILPGGLALLAATGQLTRATETPPAGTETSTPPEVKTPSRPATGELPALPASLTDVQPAPKPSPSPQPEPDHDDSSEEGPEEPELSISSPPPVQSPRDRDHVEQLAGPVAACRFSAAHAMAEDLERDDAERWAYRVAALAQAVRSPDDSCGVRLSAELRDVTTIEPEPVTLLVTVPALIRTGLIIGTSHAGALLIEASRHLDPELGAVAERVGRVVVSGALAEVPLIGMLADVAELERRLAQTRAEASARLGRHPTLRFPRATAMAKIWLDGDKGLLGSLLAAAARDDRDALADVRAEVTRLNSTSEINREIDRLDYQLRLNGARPLQGHPRQNLQSLATGALSAVSAWLQAVTALERQHRQGQTWATREIGDLRAELLRRRDTVATALSMSVNSPDALAAAAARAAANMMKDTFSLLAGGQSLSPDEFPADLVLTVERLKTPGARLDPDSGEVVIDPLEGAKEPSLAEALTWEWEEAYARHLAAENYPAALAIIDLARRRDPLPGGPTASSTFVESDLRTAMERSRRDLLTSRDALTLEMRRARGQNELSEQEDTHLRTILTEADPLQGDRTDLHEVRRRLNEIRKILPQLRDAAAGRLRDRLSRVVAERQTPVDPAEPEKISQLINAGRLSIAEELIYCLENDADLPSWEPRADLERFFPTVPNALPNGITNEHIETVRTGGKIEGLEILDCSTLSEGARERGAKALQAWRLLASTPPDGRGRGGPLEHLASVLRLAGMEPSRIKKTQHLGNSTDRRFVEASEIRFVGHATLPQFGTGLCNGRSERGNLRVLLAWGRPPADLLMSWIDHDRSGDSLLVAYFGTMTEAVRRALAVRAVASAAPAIVLDDAALAYLAVHGEGQLSTALAVTLPFSAINPYVRDKRGAVAPEMFYGRDQERRAILDPNGTQVIFGGRGLGKSALLRASKIEFERTPERLAVFLDLRPIVGTGALAPGAVWDKLRQQLIEEGVLQPGRAKGPLGDSREAVRSGLRTWLDTDSQRRLLILLDEADGFFESDAPAFVETTHLKALGADFDGRVKVVFAGLHSVQRFAKIGRNGPFSHLAQRPVVIGPLGHQHAFDLIARPLRALGLVIEPDLIHQINGYCAYQPFLLQMFGHRLIEIMHRRRTDPEAGPPYAITSAEVEAVISDQSLKADIIRVFRDTLNLDSRYNIVANVLAHHAYERGMDARLSENDLRAECRQYWPEGFAELDFEAFRAYLQEMAGLGVLHHDTDGLWQLRSLNVLPMIGNPDDVLTALVNASTEQVPHRDHVLQRRRQLHDGGTRSPLTEEQVDDLLGEHANQCRVVLGSRALGIDLVTRSLEEVVADLKTRFRLSKPTGVNEFRAALVEGTPGDRRIVMSDLARKATKVTGCRDSLKDALTLLPDKPGVTRSAILVADPGVIPFWEDALTLADHRMSVVLLRRHTRATLKTWALETDRFGNHLDELYEKTSGWPHLVERAGAESLHRSEERVLERLSTEIATPQRQQDLLDAVGLLADRRLARAYKAVTDFADDSGFTGPDLSAAVEQGLDDPELDSAPIVHCLLALDVLNMDGQGRYHLEPLVASAWSALRSAQEST